VKNLGITDNIYRILLEEGKPMKQCEVARKMAIPNGWNYAKLRRNVASMMINELIPGHAGRWRRVAPRLYEAVVKESWVKAGITIQHKMTGAEVKVVGKLKRNGFETTLDRWYVYNPTTDRRWPLNGDDIRRNWRPLGGKVARIKLPIPVF
jgi:hypothetical protein